MDRGWRWGGRGSRFWRIISWRMGRLRFRKRCAGIWGRIESGRRGRLRRATRLENGKGKIEKGNKKAAAGLGCRVRERGAVKPEPCSFFCYDFFRAARA